MKFILFGILICVAVLAITTNCESLAHLKFDNIPEEGAMYQLGSMSLMSYRNGLTTFDSKGKCCCSSGTGTCTFDLNTTECTITSGSCKCGACS